MGEARQGGAPAGIARLLDAIGRGDEVEALAVVEWEPESARGAGDAGESPLLAALYRGLTRVAQAIARRRVMSLAEAAAIGDEGRVDEILARGTGALGVRSPDGWTALHLAAFMGQRGVVRRLLDAGADLAAYSDNAIRNQPLHAGLAGKADAETVALLIDRGADVNGRGALGITPLHLAASRGAVDLIALLLARGADRSARMDDGTTPAQMAEQRGHGAAAALPATGSGAG